MPASSSASRAAANGPSAAASSSCRSCCMPLAPTTADATSGCASTNLWQGRVRTRGWRGSDGKPRVWGVHTYIHIHACRTLVTARAHTHLSAMAVGLMPCCAASAAYAATAAVTLARAPYLVRQRHHAAAAVVSWWLVAGRAAARHTHAQGRAAARHTHAQHSLVPVRGTAAGRPHQRTCSRPLRICPCTCSGARWAGRRWARDTCPAWQRRARRGKRSSICWMHRWLFVCTRSPHCCLLRAPMHAHEAAAATQACLWRAP
jgi:hypothetical protein